MGSRRLAIYFHLIWRIRDDSSLILPEMKRPILRCIIDQVRKLGCEIIAINGVSDHVHLLVKLKSTIAIALLVKQAKGVSAKFINDQYESVSKFYWKAGYGAFTISRWDLPMIINYVKNQEWHHFEGSLNVDLESPE